jgi:O-antigen ligase
MAEANHNERHEHSRIGKVIVALLLAIPMIAALAYGAVDSLALGVMFVLVAIVSILWIVDSWRSGEFRYHSGLIQLPLIGLILIAVIQLLPLGGADASTQLLSVSASRALSADPYATRFFLIQLIVYFLFFAAALVYMPGGERTKRVGISLVVFGSLLAFFGILQRLSMPDSIYGLRPTPQAIPFGPFVNQHHFAALMQLTSGVALGILFGSGITRERKIFVALAAGIMGMAVIFTGSRGGLIGYLCVVAFSAVASFVRRSANHREDPDTTDRTRRNLFVIIAAGGLVVLVLASVLFLGGQGSLMRSVGLGGAQVDDPTSGRAHFWSGAWQIFLENPIIGSGLNSFGVAFTRFDTWSGFYRVEQAHNDYLQMLADGGILAVACVAVFVFLLLKIGIAAVGDHRDGLRRSVITGALAGCLGILIHSFFDFPLRTPANGFFFLMLVVLVTGNDVVRRKSRSRR